jgi:hypothetical protein
MRTLLIIYVVSVVFGLVLSLALSMVTSVPNMMLVKDQTYKRRSVHNALFGYMLGVGVVLPLAVFVYTLLKKNKQYISPWTQQLLAIHLGIAVSSICALASRDVLSNCGVAFMVSFVLLSLSIVSFMHGNGRAAEYLSPTLTFLSAVPLVIYACVVTKMTA